ncbi:Ribosomal RNA large subunit methyltransferase I [Aquicella siphonis]|uniref:Ribosomal RNA large subunit methyltransferase I n=1 Tax=Aquicella siphonis TaxID=254247 RepID=A0A5E4PJS8_9COXI|nr:class I SAM-dependent rRNA methyltransferase [Aquicella siphonis]VVC77310.1 Ribosomal RNA large subunit methyltransferase I [Aquicella siphonis]
MPLPSVRLKKGEDRRIRSGHPWVYSNEIDTRATPMKSLNPGQEVFVQGHDQTPLGVAYANPHSLIAARLFSRNPEDRLDQGLITRRILAALALREHLFSCSSYRLVFSEADQLPGVVIDRFGNDFVMQINTAGMELKTNAIVGALRECFPDLTSLLLRNDSPIRVQEGLEIDVRPAFGRPPDVITLEENGITFTAPLLKGQKTGWFYDHRLNRARLRAYARHRTVLDVFSYVGGWGVQAAVYGANHVDCIEVSELAAGFIAQNAKLNQVENQVSVICDDAFTALKRLHQQGKQYQVIVLDPPAFIKKAKDRKEGLLAYQRLNELALKLLPADGILFSCSCSMHLSMEDLIGILQRCAYRTQSTIQILERGHQGPDHPVHLCIPETDYLKAVVVRKQG